MAKISRQGKKKTTHPAQGCDSLYGLERAGVTHVKKAHWNLPVPRLIEMAVDRGEGYLAPNGTLVV